MTRTAFFKLAATGAVAAIGLGVPSAIAMANGGDAPRENPARAARSADRAETALERGRVDRAVTLAEGAVLLSPNDASYRSLLGQAYLAAGRFQSAADSFDAASQLGAVDSRSIIGHALALIGTDRPDQAVALLDANAQSLPASDYGLALAMAGQAERGALVLTDVVRAGGSTARDRQNLALAYALSSRWLEARLIAAQDLIPDQVQARMTQWAQLAQAGSGSVRVAALIGTTPAHDRGMPVQLALHSGQPGATALAANDDPAPLAMYAPPAPAETEELVAAALEAGPHDMTDSAPAAAPAESAPVAVASAELPPSDAAPVAVASGNGITFVSNPVIQPLRDMVAMVAPLASERSAPNTATPAAPARPVRVAGANVPARPAAPAAVPASTDAAPARGPVVTSGWSVQLGAFQSLAVAQERWGTVSRRHAAVLGGHDAVSTSATVNGRTVYRLSATGFASRAAAASVCATVARAGGDCFVRQLPAGENVRWASRQPTTRVASR